jgi:isopentenyl-diphosphate delta-isomerase
MTTRKRRHIDVCLDDRVAYSGVTTGLERYCLPYNALTQTSLAHIDLSTEFLGASLRAPILIGAMTGGAELSGTINRNLAAAAQRLGVGMMLGSQRIMLDSALGEEAASSFTVRDVAPDVLLFGNIGLSQLTVAAVEDISNALKRVGADVLAVHANPLQEAVQRNGDSDFAGSIDRLREVAGALEYPVLLKEVGLADWGIPTAQAIVEVRGALPTIPLVASGGIRTGMDAAKALALGADVVAIARPLLAAAIESSGAVIDWLQRFIDELGICLHGAGATDLRALRDIGVTPMP